MPGSGSQYVSTTPQQPASPSASSGGIPGWGWFLISVGAVLFIIICVAVGVFAWKQYQRRKSTFLVEEM